MSGSLIGIFLTVAGIVVGTDSAAPGRSHSTGVSQTRVEKACRTGPRTVAVMQGWFGEDLSLNHAFHVVCRELARSKKVTLDRQADRAMQQVEQRYRRHLGTLPALVPELPPPLQPHVAYVAVAGFDGVNPALTVRELRWGKKEDGRWRLETERAAYLDLRGCGLRFIGTHTIAKMLLDGAGPFETDQPRPEVAAGREVDGLSKREECRASTFTVQEAKALYVTAVRATIDHAGRFLVDATEVGGRLHLLTIPPTGPVQEAFLSPEEYVGETSSPNADGPAEQTTREPAQ